MQLVTDVCSTEVGSRFTANMMMPARMHRLEAWGRCAWVMWTHIKIVRNTPNRKRGAIFLSALIMIFFLPLLWVP